jgi:hypothetical protein
MILCSSRAGQEGLFFTGGSFDCAMATISICSTQFVDMASKLFGGGTGLAREPFGPQPFAVLVERLSRGLMLTHGLLGVGAPLGVAGLALFGSEDSGGADFEIFGHAR